MGYTTEFQGAFKIKPALKYKDIATLLKLAKDRHEGPDGMEDPKFPSYYCQWIPSDDGTLLHWDGNEKFYNYVEWLKLIIHTVLIPGNYILSGKVQWIGEDKFSDQGTITVKANEISLKRVR